jgi:hypothetical protein
MGLITPSYIPFCLLYHFSPGMPAPSAYDGAAVRHAGTSRCDLGNNADATFTTAPCIATRMIHDMFCRKARVAYPGYF